MKIKAIYDKAKMIDRYTVYFDIIEKDNPKMYQCLSLSERPFHPQGIGQHSSGMLGPHNGKKIEMKDLPLDCQKAVYQDLFPLKVRPLKKLKRKYSYWPREFAGKVYEVKKYDNFVVNSIPVNDIMFVVPTGPNDYDYQLIYPDECQVID